MMNHAKCDAEQAKKIFKRAFCSSLGQRDDDTKKNINHLAVGSVLWCWIIRNIKKKDFSYLKLIKPRKMIPHSVLYVEQYETCHTMPLSWAINFFFILIKFKDH